MRRALAVCLLALGAGACGPDPEALARRNAAEAAARDAGVALDADAGPPAPHAAAGEIRRVAARADVPLVGDRIDAKPGDWLILGEASVAVVSKKGAVVDFGPRGGLDAMTATEPTVFGNLNPERLDDAVFRLAAGGHVLAMERKVVGKKASYHAFFFLRGDVLVIESLVLSTGDEALVVETLGETVGWGNVPTWVEGAGFPSAAGAFRTNFVARESLGLAYALGSDEGHTVARLGALENNGFWDSPYVADRPTSVAARGSSPRRTVSIAWSTSSLGDAALKLPAVAAKYTRKVALPALPAGTAVEISSCDKDRPFGKLVTRYAFAKDRASVAVPEGCHGLRFTRLGHAPGKWTNVDDFDPARVEELLPRAGAVRFRVTEKGGDQLLPARLLFRGVQGTKDPWWGDDPDRGAALNTIYSAGEDEFAIPPGRYDLLVQRGFEYDAVARPIEVKAGETLELEIALERVVDTAGWLSADLHVHQAPSPDAPSPLPDRVRSLAASGVEVAVATDHNKITDYGPTVRDLHLERRLATVVGDEITTKDPSIGHYNAFPLPPGAEPVLFEKAAPAAIFDAARAAGAPGLVPIVQVNHPRMAGIGYFDLLRMDGTDIERWRTRSNVVALKFDAIELFNGDHYAQIAKVEEAMKDWYALLKAGFHETATGNSDSHKLTYAEAGVPRNYVRVPNDDPAAFDPQAFVEAIRAGRVVVSSGPFVRLTAGGHEIGDDVPEGEVELEVRVDAAPWVDVDKVELVVDGEVVETFTGAFGTASKRFEKKVTKRLERGQFVLAVARGTKPMTFLHRSGARPFAFTNPIFVR